MSVYRDGTARLVASSLHYITGGTTMNQMVIRADARAMGAVTATDTRVAPRWQGTPKALQMSDTVIDGVYVPGNIRGSIVRVTYADGTSEYKSASSFRAKHISTRATTHKRSSLSSHRIMAADLAPIGNVE